MLVEILWIELLKYLQVLLGCSFLMLWTLFGFRT